MGPSVKPSRTKEDAAPPSTSNKDAEIARLRAELELCNMKIAQFQARVILTLDELDTQRAAHQRELMSERRSKEKLSDKLDLYLEELKRVEAEKDDMREVVTILLEKVESCNNLAAWPCPRLSFASTPGSHSHLLGNGYRTKSDQDMRDVAQNAVVVALQQKLAAEKAAHIRTKEEADTEILRLKAMVARRDAELEACVTHNGHRVLLSSAPSGTVSSVQCTDPRCAVGRKQREIDASLSVPTSRRLAAPGCNEHLGADTVLAQTLSRNRVLEREVEMLRDNVAQAQCLQSMITSGCAGVETPRRRVPQRQDAAVQVEEKELEEHLPSSPGLLPHTMPSSPSPYNLTPTHARTPARPRTPRSPRSSTVQRLGSPSHVDMPALKHDVDHFSEELNGFLAERAAVKAMLSRELHITMEPSSTLAVQSTPVPAGGASAHLVDDCTMERQVLREQLDAMKRDCARRENELKAEIASLQKALLNLHQAASVQRVPHEEHAGVARYARFSGHRGAPPGPSPHVSPTLVPRDTRAPIFEKPVDHTHVHEQQQHRTTEPEEPGESDELGEQSMELATPLLHSTILSVRDEDWPTPPDDFPAGLPRPHLDIDPVDVPLPASPDEDRAPGTPSPPRFPSPPLSTSSASAASSSSSPPLYIAPPRIPSDLLSRVEGLAEARVANLEAELAATQRELADKEAVLADVCDAAARLHSQLHASPQSRPPSRAGADGR
ncbi:hypothetical protein BD413DRAFT_614883 [Trametes elegans]|nr:hypothetical protein BD413DRAFT_614883 [Trametes elegans]